MQVSWDEEAQEEAIWPYEDWEFQDSNPENNTQNLDQFLIVEIDRFRKERPVVFNKPGQKEQNK